MTEPKRLHSVRADCQYDERMNRTGRVEVRAIPSWLKQQVFIPASLTPKQARTLAIDLLIAADRAEEKAL